METKKNILIISDLAFSYTVGGTEMASSRLANKLSEDTNYDVSVFTSELNKKKPSVVPNDRLHLYRFGLLPFIGNKQFGIFTLPNPFLVRQLIQQIHPDCIHVHTPYLLGLVSVYFAHKMNIPSVYTNHIFAEHFAPETKTLFGKIKRKLIDRYLSWYMNKFDAIIYPSKIQRESIHEKYKLRGMPRVISNGFTPLSITQVQDKPSYLKDKLVFLSVSRLAPEKNIHLLIEAFIDTHKQYPNTVLLIVGGGDIQKELETKSGSSGVSDSIFIVGEKRGNDLANYYSWGNIFVSASNREAEPVTVLEATGFLKPLILSDALENGGRQFVENNGILFRKNDTKSLSEAMNSFAKDEGLLSIGIHGGKIVEKYYFNRVIDLFKKLYSELIISKQGS